MNELAIQLIRKEKEEKTGKLDLGKVKLSYFPEELFELEWLNELDLWVYRSDEDFEKWDNPSNQNHQLALPQNFARFQQLKKFSLSGDFHYRAQSIDCSILASLASLTHLSLLGCKISDTRFLKNFTNIISLNLSHNQISNICYLEKYTNLKYLDLSYNRINDCHFLEKLTNLTNLDLSYNQISDCRFLTNLTRLTNLGLSNDLINNIPSLEKLTDLISINLSRNQIRNYDFLGKLYGLTHLDLSYNLISDYNFLNKLTFLTSLNLHNCQIEDISFLEKLTALTSLDLSSNKISDISFLEKMTALTSLNLRSNQISDISFLEKMTALTSLDLDFNQISDCSFLEKMTALTSLDLRRNQISDCGFLEKMTALTSLDLSSNQISDCGFLEKMTALTSLDLSSNQISDCGFLEKLTALTSLDLSNNKISDISFLEEMTALTRLDLGENKIHNIQALIPLMQKELPIEFGNYRLKEGISLYDNPIKKPPSEIIKQGREVVLDWFEAKKKKLNEIKIIFLGDPKAGKTSLLKRLKFDTFNEDEPQTDGVNIEDIEFGECEMFKRQQKLHKITGHFWDFGGQEIMNATHQFFLTKRSVYVLVLDARKDANNSSQVRQWVKRIKATGGDSPIIVLANQTDVNPGFGFENERELQNEFPQIKCFLKVSCKNDVNIDLFKNKLEEIIPMAELFNTQIDERWITIKEILEKETRKDYFLNESRFVSVCNKAGLTEKPKQKNAITFLHDLGLVLHFDDLNLAEYYVLNPYWITYGVYQILTSSYAGEMKGKVVMDQLNFIVNEEEDKKEAYNPANYRKIEYTCNERRFLVDILNQFKLCFCMAGHNQFIIPDLLDTKEPSEVTEPIRASKECIQFVYDYEYLPKFVMPNIMVEMNQMITDMWRTGCVLQYDGCRALINNYQNRISIVVVGEHKKKREFMSVIRFVINSINEKLSDKPVALIPLPGIKDFADYERLIARERKGKKDYIHDEDKETAKKFLISELLVGISDLDEMIQFLLPILKNINHNIKKIDAKLDIHYKYLVNLPDNEKIKSSIHEAIQELNVQQTEKICKEIMEWVTTVFVQFDGIMDEKLKDIYNDLKETDDIQAKLKLSIPFINMLGINFETELDVKSWAKKMCQKYKSKIFNLLY